MGGENSEKPGLWKWIILTFYHLFLCAFNVLEDSWFIILFLWQGVYIGAKF